MTITMTAVWEEAQAFIRKEWQLLAPLGLATLGVGGAGSQLIWAQTMARGPGSANVGELLIMLGFMLLVMIGQLAIISLALGSRRSVGEALNEGLRTLPRVIGANLIISLPFLLLALPLAYGLLNSGITATTVNPKIPATMLFYAMLLIGLIAYVSVRLVVINQVLMAKKRGVVESLRDAWTMTRPVLWQILGVAILFVVVSFIVSGAATAIFGSLFVLGAKAMGSPFLGAVLTALMGGMISAGFSIISTVFVTFLYSRLVPSSNGI